MLGNMQRLICHCPDTVMKENYCHFNIFASASIPTVNLTSEKRVEVNIRQWKYKMISKASNVKVMINTIFISCTNSDPILTSHRNEDITSKVTCRHSEQHTPVKKGWTTYGKSEINEGRNENKRIQIMFTVIKS